MTSVTRRYRFCASHRLHSAALTDQENARLYGKCNNPFGHGHDYILEVTASGPVDRETGLVAPVRRLDRLVQEQVLALVSNRNLNLDVAELSHVVPTTENIALMIVRRLEQHWAAYLGSSRARLARVHVQETDRNGFEVLLAASDDASAQELETERLPVHA